MPPAATILHVSLYAGLCFGLFGWWCLFREDNEKDGSLWQVCVVMWEDGEPFVLLWFVVKTFPMAMVCGARTALYMIGRVPGYFVWLWQRRQVRLADERGDEDDGDDE